MTLRTNVRQEVVLHGRSLDRQMTRAGPSGASSENAPNASLVTCGRSMSDTPAIDKVA